jgi:hypothetical protein
MSFSTIKARIAEVDEGHERRGPPRMPVQLEAHVRELGATGVDARILNLSERGFMAEANGRFEVGSRIWLIVPGRERASAVVRWTAGGKLGGEFAEPITIDAFLPR